MKKLEKLNTPENRAEELHSIRSKLGLTLKDMAPVLLLGHTYLSQLENGRKPVADYILIRAREALKRFEKSNEDPAQSLNEHVTTYRHEDWKERAMAAERHLNHLREGMKVLLGFTEQDPMGDSLERMEKLRKEREQKREGTPPGSKSEHSGENNLRK